MKDNLVRKEINFNGDWKFILGDDSNSHCTYYDDSLWESVSLPHAVKLSPANASGGRNYQGLCRYRKHFNLPEEYDGKKIYIKFEGAMSVAQVWINDLAFPVHYGGYLPFLFDITDSVKYGSHENIISVRLDNSDNPDVPPGKPQQDLDFTYEGGLYRNVSLIITDKLHITDAVYADIVAGGGIFVTYPEVTKEYARVSVKTHVINEREKSASFEVINRLLDSNGEVFGLSTTKGEVQSKGDNHFTAEIEVDTPRLWHPYDPQLYTLVTEIVEKGRVIDNMETIIGIRTFEFTKEGFFINGERLKISGANYHQTCVYIGNAMPDSMLRRDARKLREAGFFHIRSHYPFAPSFIDECNRLGHAIIVSAPGWQWFKEGIFVERAYQNVRDMVRWQRNNPSVILWEPILNESSMPDWFQKRVQDIVHEEYPSSPCYTGSDHGPTDVAYREFDPGMLGFSAENHNPEELKKLREEHEKPLWVREYGDSPDNWTDQSCAWRVPREWGEYAMLKQVERMINPDIKYLANYIKIYNKPKVCGFGVWPGMEHNRGYHINPCWGGVFDLYKIPKYSYYFFRSQQDPDIRIDNTECGPMLFIANWWTEISPEDVVVYSNCEEVRLYHNNELIAVQKPDNLPIKHPPFTFKNIRKYKDRERSEIRAEGLIGGRVVAQDKRFSPGVPKSLSLQGDFMGINLKADGSDIVMVYCDVVDDRGTIVPMNGDNFKIRFSIEGEGKIVGDESIGANPINPVMGRTGILVQATRRAGKIRICARVENPQRYSSIAIKAAELEFYSIKD